MIMKRVAFGIIGPGNIARKFAEAVAMVDDAYIAAVSSKSSKRAEDFAKEYGIAAYYDDYDEMCKAPDIDVVYISTTNNFHYENMLTCIKHNKHILCEKPMVMRKMQAVDVFKKAAEKDLFVMEALWSRFLPAYKKIKELICSGSIGDIRHIESSFNPVIEYDPNMRLFSRDLGGSVLYDLGVYNISLTLYLAGEKPSGYTGYAVLDENDIDISDNVIMQFPSGTTADFTCGVLIQKSSDMTVYGSKGKIKLNDHFISSHEVELYDKNGMCQSFEYKFENGFVYQIQEVIDCIRKGSPQSSIMPHKDTLDVIEIIESLLMKWGVI
jgi:predicted dehydrogenase